MSYSLPSLSLRKQSFAIPQRAQVVRSCSPTLIALACGEPPCVRATLAHRFAVEPAQACGEQQQIEDNQHSEDNQQRKMRELRHQRSAQAIFDFVRELKLRDHRHGHGPDARAHHADGHDARQQQALVGGRHVAAAHHHSPEDEHKHQRLEKRLEQQRHDVAARHMGVARENRQKGFPVHSRKLLPVWCRKRFSRLGSEICTSCSSTPEAEARCATSGISEPPRSAYTSAPTPSVTRTSRTPESFCRRSRNSPECRPNRNCRRKPPGTEAFNSRGVPRAITRPWSMMARRWQSVSASSMLCVVSRMVLPVWLYSRTISHRSKRVCGSRPALGSSRNSTCGSCTMARAMERRCIMPPEKPRTIWSARSVR